MRSVRSRRLPLPGGLLAAFAFQIALTGFGCVEPQSGQTAKHWCVPTDSVQFDVVDDMEDGDGFSCRNLGKWSAAGSGSSSPPSGPLTTSADLNGADLTARSPSLRALHLSGTTGADGYDSLSLRFDANMDLTGYQEIQFWARSASGTLDLRVNVQTAATSAAAVGGTCDSALGECGDHFGDVALITETWGDQGNPNSIALAAITQSGTGQVVPDKDLAHTLGLEFRVSSAAGAAKAFDFWIDDIQLKRPPTQ